MKNFFHKIAPFAVLAVLAACNLSKDVDLNLPDYEHRPVVECYLEPGKPFRLFLTQSVGFFEPFDTNVVNYIQRIAIDSADVRILHGTDTFRLKNQYDFDPSTGRLFNYVNFNHVPADYTGEFRLEITLKDGKTITAKTVLLPVVPIDSVVVNFNPDVDTLARTLCYITDNPNTRDFYRRVLQYATLDSLPRQDFLVRDEINQTNTLVFGSGYRLRVQDTVFNTIYHITEDHFNFIESYNLAILANINPFVQPAQIKSNLGGTADALGIFTCLAFARDTTIIHK